MMRRDLRSTTIGIWLAVSSVGLAPSARAQGRNDAAAAEALFKEGKKLMGGGQYAAACPKFAESQRLDPGIGTMLWLGDCYAKNNQFASAWATFHEAEALAAKQRDPRVGVAREEAQKHEPRMSKLVIDATNVASVADIEIKRDGVVLGRPLWGTPTPIDGGSHVITASAPGRKPWESTVSVPLERGSVAVKIPELETVRTVPVVWTAAEAPVDPIRGPPQRVAGIIVLGLGVVGVAVGSYFGVMVKSKNDDSNADNHCTGNFCDPTGAQLRHDAQTYGTYADVAFLVGGAALVGGAILYLTAPNPTKTASLGITLAGSGGALRATF